MHVILHAELNDWSRHPQTDETIRNEENRIQLRDSEELKLKHDNSIASLGYGRVNNPIIFVTTRLAISIHQHVVPQQSTQNTAN